jgi:pimeloyl-ACP methyl ester carboxylesterase
LRDILSVWRIKSLLGIPILSFNFVINFTSSHPMTYSFETAPGMHIAAEGFGNPAHRPVLLLHGGGQTRHSWGDTAAQIAQQGWYSITLDARGHGDSTWGAPDQYHAEHLVGDLRAIIGQLDQKPAIVGASMGGITGMLLEGEVAPQSAAALVLVDIAPKPEQKGIERIFAFMSANMENGFASLDEVAESVAAYLPHRPKPTDFSRLEKNLRKRENGRYYWHWDPALLRFWQSSTLEQRLQHEQRLFGAASNLQIPTLIVRGGISDVVSERVMAEFMDTVPLVRSVTVSGAGHMVAGDSNHAFSKAVITFLSEVFPPY